MSPPTAHDGSSGQVLEQLLEELRRRKWVLHLFGGREAPELYAAVHEWPTCADVIILRDEHRASAYRVPTFPGTDVFAPRVVTWQYHATPVWTLRAVLTLAEPGTPGAPLQALRPQPECHIPPGLRRDVTIRPTSTTEPAEDDGGGPPACA
ncbi:hypothetical protein [Amycolatopsis australiensis]|uniref:Uncharacterized protein n=1 Tax=Amycolatopsis australiensis TaxID=546364 RepID=A0A1K1T2F8_9PSEU|nr:hypothetical protein [Amycolatopsis australiensis]SFW90686.1 hypothetical protein SAMN04489730_7655 [Amycolatopsis australiensis]